MRSWCHIIMPPLFRVVTKNFFNYNPNTIIIITQISWSLNLCLSNPVSRNSLSAHPMYSLFEGIWLGGSQLQEAEAVIVPWIYHGPQGRVWAWPQTQATLQHAVRCVHLGKFLGLKRWNKQWGTTPKGLRRWHYRYYYKYIS